MSVYACSDLHGYHELYKQIKAFLSPDDKVYFLGDAGDRGPEPWKTIKAILQDEQFVYIQGNHDDMLIKAVFGYFGEEVVTYTDAYQLLYQNGGAETIEEIFKERDPRGWARHLHRCPTQQVYTRQDGKTIYLSHSGKISSIPSEVLWDRQHYMSLPQPADTYDYIIHGHTPIQHIIKEMSEVNKFFDNPRYTWKQDQKALWYDDGHKCCIDLGTYRTEETVLINLDTFEEHVFKV